MHRESRRHAAVLAAVVGVVALLRAGAGLAADEAVLARPKPTVAKPKLPAKITRARVIPLRETITRKTLTALRRKIDRCRKDGAQLIVLDMDTSGGEINAAIDASRLLKFNVTDIYTVCYVRPRAYGAGMLIALACDEIVVAPSAKLGDCVPKAMTGTLRGAAGDKTVPFLRAEVRESAERHGYPPAVAERLVDTDGEVWLIREIASGKRRYVLAGTWRGRVKVAQGITDVPSNPNADWELVQVAVKKGPALTLTAKQAVGYGLASAVVPAAGRDPLAGLWKHLNVTGEPVVLTDEAMAAPDAPAITAEAAGPRPYNAPPDARISQKHEGWFAARRRGQPLPPLPAEVTSAFVIPLREPITTKTFGALERKAARCRGSGAQLVILDMDTWGGEVGAALDVARLLKTQFEDIRTVCYVRTRGVSAGALIALACDEIIITPVGKLGDCAPIVLQGKLEGVEREKVETVLRKEFAESAKRNGYSVALAESMVSITREVWLVRNKVSQELRFVLAKDFRGKVTIPPGVTSVPSNPASPWDLLQVVVPNGELLTMTPDEAVEFGFAARIVKAPLEDPLANVRARYDLTAAPTVLEDNWSERLAEFLTLPAVLSFLFFVAILAAYVEINTPGFGVAGAIAIACFAIIFGSRYLVGMANWWEIALFVVGLILLAVEVFVTPGFGLPGIAGILCCIVALLTMLVPNAPDKLPIPTAGDWSVFTNGALALAIGFLAALVGIYFLARYLPKVPVAGRLILQPSEPGGPAAEEAPIRHVQPGQRGTVTQICRPVGKVQVGEHLVDAVADGAFLAAGTEVVVLRNEGNRIVVESKASAPPTG